jgi:predicted enzyme related to lactoylglutathione lyase
MHLRCQHALRNCVIIAAKESNRSLLVQSIIIYLGWKNNRKAQLKMSKMNPEYPIIEFRVALTTKEYERITNIYCDGLGLQPSQFWNNGQGRAIVLDMGKATLEIFDETQAETIDQIETGQRVSGPVRFAFQVPDLQTAIERLLSHGAVLVRPPVLTPWGDYNARLQDPDGMQITLFQRPDQDPQTV